MRRAVGVLCWVLAAWIWFFATPGVAQDTPAPHPMPAGTEGQACEHCHDDAHSGTAKVGCDECHTPVSWSPTTFGIDRHAKTAFPLHDKHTEVACQKCHVDKKLTGMPGECAGCHVDRHRGKLGDNCVDCHSTKGFKPVDGFDHELTGFSLVGNHADVGCAACHTGDNGRAVRLSGAEGPTCDSCHTATHGDIGTCVGCHWPEHDSFAKARKDFDHRSTGFDLERRHGPLACAKCHPVDQAPPINRCGSCHIDPHASQLGQRCDDCHAPDRWRLARFDHDLTGWPLRGRHFVTPCASCHTNQQWIGLRNECWDCHALDAGRALSTGGGAQHRFGRSDCADCHTMWSWQ